MKKLLLLFIYILFIGASFAEEKKIIDPFEDKGTTWEEAQQQIMVNSKNVIKLVCNDTLDPSLPLAIYINNKLGMIGSTLVKVERTAVLYRLTKKDEMVDIDGIIQRNDGRFNMSIKIGVGEPMEWKGFCKKNEPKF